MYGEITVSHAKRIINNGGIVYVVANENKIIKIFDYHVQANRYAQDNNLNSYNITHPKCPRFIKFELGYIQQLDLFLDFEKKKN